ncbi:MAG: radical SAM protein [Desulfobulbaceae bacterium]|nr:radical SAM protein [Pseudomonadota bacterium]MCG2822993.1 radical SAM protein [Desulfobulbaceae bacterium]MDP2002743.1 radical SAM protein [Desulfurivibrionaceae bacterium]
MLGRLTINTSQSCNLDCSYCYAGGGYYGGKSLLMDDRQVLASLMQIVQKHNDIRLVQFIGGEPLLNLPAIRTLCKKVNNLVTTGALKNQPRFGVVTNLTILTEKHLEVLREFEITVTVSIDGPDYIHDKQRPKKKALTGTHAIILKNLARLERAGISYDFEATYTRLHLQNNVTFVDLLEYFSKWKPNRIDITPVSVSEKSELGFCSEDEQRLVVTYQLDALNYALDHLSQGHVVPYGYLREVIGLLRSESSDRYCPAGESNLAIASNGEVYGCHMFTNKKQYRVEKFTNIQSFPKSQATRSYFGRKFKAIPIEAENPTAITFPTKSMVPRCNQCWARQWCRACLGNMEIRSPGKPVPFSLHCELTKHSLELLLQRLPFVIDGFSAIIDAEKPPGRVGGKRDYPS